MEQAFSFLVPPRIFGNKSHLNPAQSPWPRHWRKARSLAFLSAGSLRRICSSKAANNSWASHHRSELSHALMHALKVMAFPRNWYNSKVLCISKAFCHCVALAKAQSSELQHCRSGSQVASFNMAKTLRAKAHCIELLMALMAAL